MSIFDTNPRNSNAPVKDPEKLLDQILYTVPGTNTNITWADAVEGQLILGSTGSGKSSGPGKHIAHAMLNAGFGMCILCAKKDERERWEKYASDCNREDDLVIFNKASGLKFNFLKYEVERDGEGAGDVLNMIKALMNLNEQNKIHQSGGGENKEEKFWDNSLRRLISRSISLLMLADEEVSIENMRKVVSGCFDEEDLKAYQRAKVLMSQSNIDKTVLKETVANFETWLKSSYFLRLIERLNQKKFINSEDETDADLVLDYWLKNFPKIADKTRGIILESCFGLIEPFMNRGILRDQFSQGLSEDLKPENIISKKKIVIIDFPIKEFGLAGIYASTIYKSVFQAFMERREIKNEDRPTPVALWIDEYQTFCNPQIDSLFQLTARSSWVASVFITQNINNLYFVMGQNMPEARAKSLLGNLNLKYACSNSDIETNKWISEMVGKHFIDVDNIRISEEAKVSKSKNQQLQYRIMPDYFTTLKTGREANDFKVEAIVFKSGKTWDETHENYAMVEFSQNK